MQNESFVTNDDVLTYRLAKWTLPFTFIGPVFGLCHMEQGGAGAFAFFTILS